MSTQPTSRAPYSLHNILETIESSATLAPRQRQDQASAIRTVARLLGNTPAGIPANPQLLARRLDEIAPARHNLSPGRWANIRSLLRAALATVTTVSPGRQQNQLTPDWAAAAAMLPPRLHHPLSKMMHFFAGQGVAPHQVDAVMRRVLGHRSIATTTSFYTGLETAAAVRHFDKTILGLRQGSHDCLRQNTARR